jgi:hypothetical protein
MGWRNLSKTAEKNSSSPRAAEQLFAHLRIICAFVLSMRQQNQPENNKNTEDTNQWKLFPNVHL